MLKRAKRERRGAEFVRWMEPLLDCLRELGAARPRQVVDWIAEKETLPENARELLESKQERFYNQVHWARQYLVWEGLLDDSKHGIWSLTPRGIQTHLSEAESRDICLKWVRIHAEARKRAVPASDGQRARKAPAVTVELGMEEEVTEAELLTVLRSLSPTGFERICRHLLLAYGFENVTNTRQTRDGGIDGEGILQINPFVSSVVVFQCKRYRRAVTREEVTRLRGDAGGRADKAILITTGTFTSDGRKEADRVTPRIELIDGDQLVAMFEEKQLGMKPRTVYEVDHAFFEQFKA
jgi:restriction system protein